MLAEKGLELHQSRKNHIGTGRSDLLGDETLLLLHGKAQFAAVLPFRQPERRKDEAAEMRGFLTKSRILRRRPLPIR